MFLDACETYQADLFFLTGVTFGLTAWNEFDALGAGAGVAARSEQTQVAAGSLTRVLRCKDEETHHHITLS